jgi:hypothetical protein
VQTCNDRSGSLREEQSAAAGILSRRFLLQMGDITFGLQEFVDRYEGRYHDIQLPLPLCSI